MRALDIVGWARRAGELGRRHRTAAFFIGVAIVYTATGTYGGMVSGDTYTAAVASWALAVHHSVDLRPILAHAFPGSLEVAKGAHGTIVSDRFPGAVLLAFPFYLIGGGQFGPIPATLAAALAAAGACALVYRILLRLQPPRVALIGASLFAFATSQWTVSGHELWQHSGSTLLIGAAMLAMLSRRWTLAGLASGFTMVFRPHLGLGAAALAVGLVLIERRARPGLLFCVAVIPGLVSYLTWNWVVYGRFTVSGGYITGSKGISISGVGVLGFLDNIAGTLVSPERGVLVCSPFLLLSLLGLRKAWRSSGPLVRLFAVAGLVYLASQLWLIRYSGGDGFFGYRTCLETLLWCSPLLVEAGVEGFRRTGALVSWALVAFSVCFFAACAFDLGEVLGVFNPWTSWAPFQLVHIYGLFRFLVGVFVGLGAVFVAWAISSGRLSSLARQAPRSWPADEAHGSNPISTCSEVVV